MKNSNISVGLDFGTDSVRALAVDCSSGEELCKSTSHYKRWKQELYCDASVDKFRQHPLDYLESLEEVLRILLSCLTQKQVARIISIGVDTTGSTVAPMDANGEILSLKPEFEENPEGMFVLWKDHTALQEASEISKTMQLPEFTAYNRCTGGTYSAEWFWAKILHISRKNKKIQKNTNSWVELCDWIPAILTGNIKPDILKRSRCAAGHKALWDETWQGLPKYEFFEKVDPILIQSLDYPLFTKTYTADQPVGFLNKEWSRKLNILQNVIVSVGTFDCHAGAVGAGIQSNTLVKIVGTSTCDIMVAEKKKLDNRVVKGICGQVPDSVIPGCIGLEAGQSAFGDIYAWFKNILLQPLHDFTKNNSKIKNDVKIYADSIIDYLITKWYQSKKIENTPLALDWLNGRRTPNSNQNLKGLFSFLNLSTNSYEMFGSLVLSTAFGARLINSCFESQNIPIDNILVAGGISKKSPIIMQILCDVLNKPIKIIKSAECCALGAAIYAAVSAKQYDNVLSAQKIMSSKVDKHLKPNQQDSTKYQELYLRYQRWCKLTEKVYNEKK